MKRNTTPVQQTFCLSLFLSAFVCLICSVTPRTLHVLRRRLCNRLFLIFHFIIRIPMSILQSLCFIFVSSAETRILSNDVWLRAPMATNIEKTCLHTTRQHLFVSSFSLARNCQLHVRRTKTGVAGQRRRKNPPSIGINNVQRSQQLTEEPQIFIFLSLIFE